MPKSVQSDLTRRAFLAGTTATGAALAGKPIFTKNQGSESSVPVDIGSRRELFVDGFLIERLAGAARLQLHHPQPQGIAINHDAPWEGNATAYHSIFKDNHRYRMYYRAWHLGVAEGKLSTSQPSLCYAESDDGIHWQAPNLGLHEVNGSKANNIVISTDMAAAYKADVGGPAVFKDENPGASPDARYKTFLISKNPLGLTPFKSPDGIRWSPMTDAPVIIDGAFDSQNLAFWDSARGEYQAYWRYFTKGVTDAKTWKPDGIRAIRTATSKDLVHWKNQQDLRYVDSPPEELYENGVKPYQRAPHLLIGFPVRYIDRAGRSSRSVDDSNIPAGPERTAQWPASLRALPDFEQRKLRSGLSERYGSALTEGLLMVSRDGSTFKRWNEAFLRPGIERTGTWNYGQCFVAWHLVETKSHLEGAPSELSLYASEGYWTGNNGTALRRYTLRLDGFVSVSADRTKGEAITRPFRFRGSRLELNFSTSAVGKILIELQDEKGSLIPGFTLQDCEELFGDTVDRTVVWKNSPDLGRLVGEPIRLRFLLDDADLYSFKFSG